MLLSIATLNKDEAVCPSMFCLNVCDPVQLNITCRHSLLKYAHAHCDLWNKLFVMGTVISE